MLSLPPPEVHTPAGPLVQAKTLEAAFFGNHMRLMATVLIISSLWLACPSAPASDLDDNPTALAALEAKADQAPPGNKCFLYAKLVSHMTDLAGQQFHSGESRQALETLKMVQQYAEKIHIGVAVDSKKLKDAEILIQHTAFRLTDILNAASFEDREALEATVKQLDQVQVQLMTQVFKQ